MAAGLMLLPCLASADRIAFDPNLLLPERTGQGSILNVYRLNDRPGKVALIRRSFYPEQEARHYIEDLRQRLPMRPAYYIRMLEAIGLRNGIIQTTPASDDALLEIEGFRQAEAVIATARFYREHGGELSPSYRDLPIIPANHGDIFNADEQVGFVMDDLPGEDVQALLEQGRLLPAVRQAIIDQLIDKRNILHDRHLGHGDLTFRNMRWDASHERLQLLDFSGGNFGWTARDDNHDLIHLIRTIWEAP